MGKEDKENPVEQLTPPKLARRRENRKSTFKLGRTIGEKREKLETANERQTARKKDKKKKILRVVITIIGFCLLVVILVLLFKNIIEDNEKETSEDSISEEYVPTIEITDAVTGLSAKDKITSRMMRYIGRAEKDFKDLGYQPIKAIMPEKSIREIDFYLKDVSGYLKLTIDRDSAVSVEDADRMIRYLKEKGIEDFEYIDIRVDGKAYWR